MKSLRKILKEYYMKTIPKAAWTSDIIQLFEDLKVTVTSSPVLARFDLSTPTFLNTDWSAEGMVRISMQPADDVESERTTKILLDTGECLFDLCKDGARLRPVKFGSRSCTYFELTSASLITDHNRHTKEIKFGMLDV